MHIRVVLFYTVIVFLKSTITERLLKVVLKFNLFWLKGMRKLYQKMAHEKSITPYPQCMCLALEQRIPYTQLLIANAEKNGSLRKGNYTKRRF